MLFCAICLVNLFCTTFDSSIVCCHYILHTMRTKSGQTQIISERNAYLPQLWKEAKRKATYPTTFSRLLEIMATLPTDRYYISEDQAYWLVLHKYKGMKNKYKDILYRSFLDLYNDLRLMDKYKDMPTYKVIAVALNHKAPCIGISPRRLQPLVSKYHSQWL